MDVKLFAKLVQDMRKAQIEYFKARKNGLMVVSDSWLQTSKKLEREVDAAAAAILAESTPQKMF